MKSKQKILISVIITVIFIFGIASASAREANPVSRLNLTKDQINKLATVIEGFSAKALDIASKIDSKFLELEQELNKKDRFDTKSKAKAGARNVNKLIKNISSLYGELLKLRVEYLLKAKDVFTEEQKTMLMAALLDFEMDTPENFSYHLEKDLTSLGLELTNDQTKKLLKYRADMEIREIKLNLKGDYKLLDLENEILATPWDSHKINKIIMDIVDISTKLLDNQVAHILKAKDVLTVEQKKELMHMMLVTTK
jgi:Spy/CpxP family protein refolding chaperone